MKENANKTIAINSVILYSRMIVTSICSIFTTRFALQALGINDFGLYSLLGGIISFISIFNTIMLSTSNRFIAVAIGNGDTEQINIQFNVNFIVHFFIAICTLIIAFPIGKWYIYNYVNYDGDIANALMVFNISVSASIISFIGVPYNGLLMAKERFIVFSSVDVVAHIGKLVIAYFLITHFGNKLLVYTLFLAFFTVLPVFWNGLYCWRNYYDIIKFRFVKDRDKYKEVASFSAWVSVGAIATIGKNQGAAVLVNAFFNTVMNTAMGVANSICSYIMLFSQNVTQPMAPQITKSYASGNINRTNELLLMSTKYSFLLTLIASSPFLMEPEWILRVWLGQVPPYATIFLLLMAIDNLVLSLNSGIANLIFASGHIKVYQIVTSLLNVLSIVFGYLVLKVGFQAYTLIIAYIIMSVIRVVAVQLILHKTLSYNNRSIIIKSYLPSLFVVLLFSPFYLLKNHLHPFVSIVSSLLYLIILVFVVGFSKNERSLILAKVKRLCHIDK